MKKLLIIPLLLLPLSAGAAAYTPTATTTEDLYTAQMHVMVEQPLPADLIAAGITVTTAAPVQGEVLAAGGTVTIADGVGGDVRVAGARVLVQGVVTGDVAAAGGTVRIEGMSRNVYAAGGSVEDVGGSAGNVTIYGVNVLLSGDYAGNVSVVASNRLVLSPGTHIHGGLRYSAPEQLTAPAGVVIDGGAHYTGTYSYLPTNNQVHQYAIAGSLVFFAVRVLAGAIMAGLIAGLFLTFSMDVGAIALAPDPRRVLKTLLLGLIALLLTPIVCLVLFISFVGAGVSLLLLVLYALLIVLTYAFSGIIVGSFVRSKLLYRLRGNSEFSWQDALLGILIVHLIGLIPYLGTLAVIALWLLCAGSIVSYTYTKAVGEPRKPIYE